MKDLLAIPLLITVFGTLIHAQKQDNIWIMGYEYESANPGAEGIHLVFGDSLRIEYPFQNMPFFGTNASICDPAGNLRLYSNGCYVEDAVGNQVVGSGGLNPGLLYSIYCLADYGYNFEHNMILLPDPAKAGLFHFFHLPAVDAIYVKNILHTVIDMSANNGKGKTLFKNQVVVEDTLHYHGLHAVRHANGRDWWVVAAKQYSNRYHLLLLTPSGVEARYQDIGPVDTGTVYGGALVFSPDGSRLARFDAQDDLRIFDFDRCSGMLSNPIHVRIHDDADIEILAGLAWSADSRYLYAAEVKRLLQFDTWAPDIAASMVDVAEADPPVCFLSGTIGTMELGPDGMIYCRPFNGQKCMHLMKHPERAGADCTFEQNYYQFPYPFQGFPHFPNFRLGPLDGSPCDTLGLDNRPLAGWRYDKTGGLAVDFTSVSWYEPTTWQWDFGDPAGGAANYSAEKHPTHIFSAPGSYEVCLTVSNQYGADTKCKMVWVETLGTDGVGSDGTVVVLYPNPTTGLLIWTGAGDGPVSVRVFNALGQPVAEMAGANGSVSLGHLPDGLYRVQLLGANNIPLATRHVQVIKH